jgi:hypothetical protein
MPLDKSREAIWLSPPKGFMDEFEGVTPDMSCTSSTTTVYLFSEKHMKDFQSPRVIVSK